MTAIMIRFIHCIKSKPELSAREFRDYIKSDVLAGVLDQMSSLTMSNDYKLRAMKFENRNWKFQKIQRCRCVT